MNALVTLTNKLAARLDMGNVSGNGKELMETLKQTAFRGQVSNEQMTALLIVANQYGLNPWTREIYAFPDKNNGIVPVVGVDGWSRIINNHPQFDGMEFVQDEESCTCIIYRKDRAHPIKVTEYKAECKRDVSPWKSHPRRMLRHKAMIQCARLAFGYTGLIEQDEAETFASGEKFGGTIDGQTGEIIPQAAPPEAAPLPPYPADKFTENFQKWETAVANGRRPAEIVAMVSSKFALTPEQIAAIEEITTPDAPETPPF